MKTITTITTITTIAATAATAATLWVGSFISHPNFSSIEVQVVDPHKGVEYFPDFKVTYNCSSFERLEGLGMDKDGDKVTVNYGGFGRRRGFRNFKCNVPLHTEGAGTR